MKIVALGPNPAWQKTLFFDRFRQGEINRAKERREFAAGKGVNFCRAAAIHGKCAPVLIQFAGGENGEKIECALNRENIATFTVRTVGGTRCCTTCLDLGSRSMTEVIEPSFAATEQEVRQLLDTFEAALSGASAAAFCGTLPTGTDPGLYGRAAKIAAKAKIPLLVDACHNLGPVFGAGGEVILKINTEELLGMTGGKSVEDALGSLFRSNASLSFAAITDGPGNAYASDGKRLSHYRLPRLEEVINPLGCGDTASAVLTSELVAGTGPFEAFKLALAAASANCLSPMPAEFRPENAAEIALKIEMS